MADLTGQTFADIFPKLLQNPSGNIIELSDGTALSTINAATMLQIGGVDIYEKDTYTATLTPSISGTITLSANTLTYTKKFNGEVTITGILTINSVSSPTGFINLNLPFTSGSGNENRSTGKVGVNNSSSVNYNDFTFRLLSSSSSVRIHLANINSVTTSGAEEMNSSVVIDVNFTYFI